MICYDRDLLNDIGRHIAMCCGNDCESSFLFQQVSVVDNHHHHHHHYSACTMSVRSSACYQ